MSELTVDAVAAALGLSEPTAEQTGLLEKLFARIESAETSVKKLETAKAKRMKDAANRMSRILSTDDLDELALPEDTKDPVVQTALRLRQGFDEKQQEMAAMLESFQEQTKAAEAARKESDKAYKSMLSEMQHAAEKRAAEERRNRGIKLFGDAVNEDARGDVWRRIEPLLQDADDGRGFVAVDKDKNPILVDGKPAGIPELLNDLKGPGKILDPFPSAFVPLTSNEPEPASGAKPGPTAQTVTELEKAYAETFR